jgi:hypothetical protein
MVCLASYFLAPLTLLLPQETPPAPGQTPAPATASAKPPLLTPAEQAALRTKLVKYLDATDVYDNKASGLKAREKASKAREKTKEEFDKEWAKLEKKGNLIASMADLRAIFDNCFVLEKPSFSTGQLRKEQLKEDNSDYSFFLPKTYTAEKPHRTVVVMPGTATPDAAGTWAKPADYFAAVWDKTNLVNSTIVHMVTVPDRLELDPIPDFSREGDEAEEERRIRAVWNGFGQVMANYNIDRGAVFFDCGRGACGFALRFVTMFPDRFAGIVLRQPVEVDDIRLGTLTGKPVLMLKTAATEKAVTALKERLEAITPGCVTVVDATDDYPHKAAAGAIEEWMGKQRRSMSPTKVVIEPNHDRFNRAYWVKIDRADPLLGAPLDTRARLEVEADRATNRIVVKARGVEQFVLFLNDDLVDLDKEFTVVVNDKAFVEKKVRSFRDMVERMVVRRDWDYLFPVMYATTVPKATAEEKPAAEKK